MANLIRGLSENGGVVFCGVDSTQIVRKAEKLHTTSATCSAALGRLLTGAALMGSMLKDDRDQAERTGWRNLRDWVLAQMAIIEAGMASVDEVFLPYLTDGHGNTLYTLYSSGTLRLGDGT